MTRYLVQYEIDVPDSMPMPKDMVFRVAPARDSLWWAPRRDLRLIPCQHGVTPSTSPAWTSLSGSIPDGAFPDEEAVFRCAYHDGSDQAFFFCKWDGACWRDDEERPVPPRRWVPIAYLALRPEHVEAVIGKGVAK
jgi:hypothetical protein